MFNLMKTAVLMAAITALFMALGSVLGGRQGMLLALVVALGMNVKFLLKTLANTGQLWKYLKPCDAENSQLFPKALLGRLRDIKFHAVLTRLDFFNRRLLSMANGKHT